MRRFGGLRLAGPVAGLTVAFSSPATAQDASAAPRKVEVCATCHGLDGIAKIAEAPNLAGQNQIYLIEQLTAFQKGARNNEMMNVVVKDLTDADIESLAAYYSSIEIKVGKIPGQ